MKTGEVLGWAWGGACLSTTGELDCEGRILDTAKSELDFQRPSGGRRVFGYLNLNYVRLLSPQLDLLVWNDNSPHAIRTATPKAAQCMHAPTR